MEADDIARKYICLGLAIDRHFPGYVDAYFGPPELRRQVEEAEPQDLNDLRRQAEELLEAVAEADVDPHRRRFLTGQLTAMGAALRRLNGEDLPFREEARDYFGVEPEPVDEVASKLPSRSLMTCYPAKAH